MSRPHRRSFVLLFVLALFVPMLAPAQTATWRTARPDELRSVIPARAPVITERIETEFRTASGITDGNGHFIAGVVMITAGYSAEGKYSHYFLVQAPVRIGHFLLGPGDYVVGWSRSGDAIRVLFYQAATGKQVGAVDATRDNSNHRVEAFRIWPPRGAPGEPRSVIQIGRFFFPYNVLK